MIVEASRTINLGKQGDNDFTVVKFDVSGWSAYGDGIFSLNHKRSIDCSAYPCVVSYENGFVYWTIKATDTQFAGNGLAQLVYTNEDGVIIHTEIYNTFVAKSLVTTDTPPEPFRPWVDRITGMIETETAQRMADDEELANAIDEEAGTRAANDDTLNNKIEAEAQQRAEEDAELWDAIEHGGGGAVSDVQINGTSILDDGVANIPVASGATAGVAKHSPNYGSYIYDGIAVTNMATNSVIDNRGSAVQSDYCPIVPTNLDYAVKASLSDTHSTVTWTEAEKASARNKIGINLGTIRSFKTIDNIDYSRNGYLNKNGHFYEYALWHCSEKIAIPDCTKIKITKGTKFYNAQSIVFFNEAGGVTGYYPGETGDTPIINEVIDVPAGTKYVSFGSATNPSRSSVFSADTEISLLFKDKWADKTWVCVGDSLTEENIRTTKHYFDYVSDATGIQTVNMGVSGSGYKKLEENSKAFYQRISGVPSNADVVTIFGSFNDVTLISNIGTPADTTTDTICGCINTTITNLYSVLPRVQLGIVSPTPWGAISDSDNYNTYVTALKNICTMRGIPFLDLYHASGLRPWTTEGKQSFYSKDDGGGTHPDENGHKLIAPRFQAFLEQLIL